MSMGRQRSANEGSDTAAAPTGAGRATRPLVAFLVACLSLPLVLGVPGAGADDVDDLAARADAIARELLDLQGRMATLGEQFNQSQVRRERLRERQADLADRIRSAERQVAVRRADAAQYALSAYAGVGEHDVLALALDGRQWDLSRRTGYASISIGDRQQLVDDLVAAQRRTDDLVEALRQAEQDEAELTADLERRQVEASRLMAEQEALQAGVQGELADAVARRHLELATAQNPEGNRPDDGNADRVGSLGAPGGSAPSVTGDRAPDPGRDARAPADPTASAAPSVSGPPTAPSNPTAPPSTAPPIAPPVTAAPPPVVPPVSGGGSQRVANAAIAQLGVPYSWGGGNAAGPSMGFGPGAGIVGFDCSGLTLYAWAQVGVYLPHSAQIQYDGSAKVSLSQLQPGDLVFYGSSARDITHVSVYVGGGQVVHAPNARSVVQYGPVELWPGYYPWIGAARPG